MKKILLSIAALFAISTTMFAQQKTISLSSWNNHGHFKSMTTMDVLNGPRFIAGLRFMPTLTSLDFAKPDQGTIETKFVLGYGFGGMLGLNFTDHVGLQAEVIYSSLAQKYTDADFEREVKLSYINVPLLLSINTNYSLPVNLNIVAGPQLGINTGSKLSTSSGAEGTDTVNAVLAVKPADIGLAYGAGLDFGFGSSFSTRLSVGFRGVYGLIDVSEKSNSVTTDSYYVLDRSHVKTYAGYIGLTFTF